MSTSSKRVLTPGKASHGPNRGIEIQLLAKLHVDGGETLAHRRGDRAFQRDLMCRDGGQRALRQDIVESLLEGRSACGQFDPLDAEARRPR